MPVGKRQIYISDALHAILKRAAAQRGESLQALTQDILTTAVIEQLKPEGLTIQAIEDLRTQHAQEAIDTVTNARAAVDAIPICQHCNRSAPLPIEIPAPEGTEQESAAPFPYCSIGCAAPGAELPFAAFTALEDQIVTTADGSTGALFFRAAMVGKKVARPAFCYRCGREVNPGLSITVPPRRKYCFKCLRPPDAWVDQFLLPALKESGPVQPKAVEDIIAKLRPVGVPMAEGKGNG